MCQWLLLTGGSLRASSKETNPTEHDETTIRYSLFFVIRVLCICGRQENPPATQPAEPVLGLDTGSPAPAFALSDQFGHQQSNETLKGSKGTVLLFFRSADW